MPLRGIPLGREGSAGARSSHASLGFSRPWRAPYLRRQW